MGFIVEGGGAYGGKGLKEQIIELEKIAMQWGMVNLFIPLWGLLKNVLA
jgi:hypothetical protein